jgi:hypothetical protein
MEINFNYNNYQYRINCQRGKTRNGFKHVATLESPYKNPNLNNAIEWIPLYTSKCFYLNRTWESYEFQSVIYKLIRKHWNKDFESVVKLIESK